MEKKNISFTYEQKLLAQVLTWKTKFLTSPHKWDKGLISSQHHNRINKPLRLQDTADSHRLCLYGNAGVGFSTRTFPRGRSWGFTHSFLEFRNAARSYCLALKSKILGVWQWRWKLQCVISTLSHTQRHTHTQKGNHACIHAHICSLRLPGFSQPLH